MQNTYNLQENEITNIHNSSEVLSINDNEAHILLAQPRGFCAGVDRAIEIVERALLKFGAPIYVRHEIVHNRYVVENLIKKGVLFIEDLDEVPVGATLIFSAHGVSKEVRKEAENRGLNLFDATCPLVTKVHVEVNKMVKQECHILMIGHKGHPEVEGTMGQVDKNQITLIQNVDDVKNLVFAQNLKLAYVTQTTLSVDETRAIIEELKKKFTNIIEPKKQDICYATQNRQDAVKIMLPQVDIVIVVGSKNSSNSSRLLEIAKINNLDAYMVDDPNQIQKEWFIGKKRIGITAGASAPEELAQAIITKIKEYGIKQVKLMDGISENMIFPLPKGL
jgi:4-hydroxy-3-methylbut-2-enyl diphosphate reductase